METHVHLPTHAHIHNLMNGVWVRGPVCLFCSASPTHCSFNEREAQLVIHGNTIGSPALWLCDAKPAACNGCTFFLCVPHILNIKIKSIKLLVGESTPIKCLCFHRWTVLSTTLKMHYGGEGCVTDAKVMESEKQTVFGAQHIISEVLVV